MAMHRCYRHVSRDERGKIMFMSRWGKSCLEIATLLGRHRSTIRRELRRNVSQYDSCYSDESAQIRTDRRRERASHRGRLRDAGIRSYVEEKLAVGWSPELIAGRIRLDLSGLSVSHETIYQYIYHSSHPSARCTSTAWLAATGDGATVAPARASVRVGFPIGYPSMTDRKPLP